MNQVFGTMTTYIKPGDLWRVSPDLAFEVGEFIYPGQKVMIDPATGKVVNYRGESMTQPSTEKKARMPKSAADKAQEALDISGRKLKRLYDRRSELARELQGIEEQFAEQEKEHTYLSQNPYLSAVQQKLDVSPAEEQGEPHSLRITKAVTGEKGE